MQAFAGAVATVAIGMRLATAMPRLDLTEENVEAAALKYKAYVRFSPKYDDWRAVYGTPSSFEGNHEQA